MSKTEIKSEIERLRQEALEHGCTAEEEDRISDRLTKEADELEASIEEEDEDELRFSESLTSFPVSAAFLIVNQNLMFAAEPFASKETGANIPPMPKSVVASWKEIQDGRWVGTQQIPPLLQSSEWTVNQ